MNLFLKQSWADEKVSYFIENGLMCSLQQLNLEGKFLKKYLEIGLKINNSKHAEK